MVKEMAFIAYSVRDVPRARAFYGDVLGLEPGDTFGDHWGARVNRPQDAVAEAFCLVSPIDSEAGETLTLMASILLRGRIRALESPVCDAIWIGRSRRHGRAGLRIAAPRLKILRRGRRLNRQRP